MFVLTWLLGVSRGDTWLFLPDLVEVRDVGTCVVRLWSHMVAPVFRELLCLGGCVPRMLVCCVAPLVKCCGTWLQLLSALCWLVVNSGVRCRTVVVAVCCAVRWQQCEL
ncbi:hypothetical protein Taro_048596 [Colocasia esculenta]|uniref:Uncharacterized protein n=1 Tax=Colocasia esculenta TaxID=4460 RepID=A0A843X8I8_COLES|nr:hypothetical protein [Colocasia esculenta]